MGITAFAEPLYDVAFDLWFYDAHDGEPRAADSHFTAFGVVQPNWTHSGYIILYAGPAFYAGWRMYQGLLRRLSVNLWRRIKTGWGMTGLLAVHPVTMYAANFGLGAPLIIALHLNEPEFSSTLVWIASFLVYGLCALAVFAASKFLLTPVADDDEPAPPQVRPREMATI